MIIHTVKSGETVYSISSLYGVSSELTIINNGLTGLENRIPEGLSLVILEPETVYTVKENDTTRGIAYKNGITLNTLYRNNPGGLLFTHQDAGQLFHPFRCAFPDDIHLSSGCDGHLLGVDEIDRNVSRHIVEQACRRIDIERRANN